jgi:hypothetical protein
MTVGASVTSMVERYGRMHTLRQATITPGANEWTNGVATVTYTVIKMHRRHYKPNEVRGLIRELDVLFTLGPDAPVMPLKGDYIAVGEHTAATDATTSWAQIINVRPCDEGETYGALKIQARL